LSDKEGLLNGLMNEAALTQSISDVTAEIDSYLIGHIPLPLASPSDFLVRKACDMVRFYLYDIGVIEPVTKRYEAAIAFLSGVSDGSTLLSALVTKPLDDVAAAKLIQKPVVITPAKVFSDSMMAKM